MAGGGGLMHGVGPDKVARVLVGVLVERLGAGAPVVDGRALGPGGVGAGFKRLAHALLRVLLGRHKELHHPVLQELVVA